ncbi:hypothetical protein U1Q18_011166 [Sarracenia purpurea var. burkii]
MNMLEIQGLWSAYEERVYDRGLGLGSKDKVQGPRSKGLRFKVWDLRFGGLGLGAEIGSGLGS